jgi:DNA-binding IclR family transcriptional regulator
MPRKKPPSPGEKYSVPNLERALFALEALADRPDGMTMSEVASALTIPRNSAFRILATLQSHQYLLRDEATGRFRLSGKLLGLGCRGTGTEKLIELSNDLLQQLRDATGETALLGRLIGNSGVVLLQSPSKHAIKVQVEIGARFPLHTAAPSKAILAWSDDVDRQLTLADMTFTRFTERTITSRKEFDLELARCRKDGFAIDAGEEVQGITCIAAPVFDSLTKPIASIWITGPDMRIPRKQLKTIASEVMKFAGLLSQRLGYMP